MKQLILWGIWLTVSRGVSNTTNCLLPVGSRMGMSDILVSKFACLTILIYVYRVPVNYAGNFVLAMSFHGILYTFGQQFGLTVYC